MNKPVISVITPLYNRADLVGETIASVLSQTLQDWELIIVDDHSDDDSFDVAARYAETDPRIRCFRRQSEHKGAPACRNEGVGYAQTDLLVFLDSDDLLEPTCLEKRVSFMNEHRDVEMMVCQTAYFAAAPNDMNVLLNRFDYSDDLEHFLVNDNIWLTTAPTWRRSAFERVGGWDESLVCWQDWEQHVRALIKGIKYEKVDKVDSYLRQQDPSRSSISTKSMCSLYIEHSVMAIEKAFACLQAAEGVINRAHRDALRFVAYHRLADLCMVHRRKRAVILSIHLCRLGLMAVTDVVMIAVFAFSLMLQAKLDMFSSRVRFARFKHQRTLRLDSDRNRWAESLRDP